MTSNPATVADVLARCAAKDPRYAKAVDPSGVPLPVILPPPASTRLPLPACPHRSAEPVRKVECQTCGGRVQLHVFGCTVHGECTVGKRDKSVAGCCKGCESHPAAVAAAKSPRPVHPTRRPTPRSAPSPTPPPASTSRRSRPTTAAVPRPAATRKPALAPLHTAEIGPAGLARTPDRGAFNGGHVRYNGRLLLAHRAGWAGSACYLAEITEGYAVKRSVPLALLHPECAGGAEDPRPFIYRGRLHVSFVGVWWRDGKVVTSQLYARLSDAYRVEAIYAPQLPTRQWPKEKNWAFFEGPDGNLYAVYSIRPHVVLRIDGDRAAKVYEAPYPASWAGGHLRGGASPVLVGDRFYHWFHGKVDTAKPITYSVGVYAFAATPPFAPLAGSPAPLVWADPDDARRADRSELAVTFPGGATLAAGRWAVSGGRNDNRLDRQVWAAADVDRLLGLDHPPPPEFTLRPGTSDRWVWDEVVALDDYGLAAVPAVLDGGAVLDIGGHVGTFAYAAVTRGAAVVHSYEPDPESYAVLADNAARMPGVVAHPAPVRGTAGEGLTLAPLGDEWNKGSRRVVPAIHPSTPTDLTPPTTPTILAPAVGIADAIRRCAAATPAGRVALLKLDCEGSEWDILPGLAADPTAAALTDHVLGEWHPPHGLAAIRSTLTPLGFTVTGRPVGDGDRGVFTARRA